METKSKEGSTGEFRCLTLEEIASIVKQYRQRSEMKQVTLAQLAGVTERTIQRVESGQKVDDQTLEALSVALGLSTRSLIGPRLVRSSEEAAQEVLDFLDRWQFVPTSIVSDWRDLQSLMTATVVTVDTSKLDAEATEKAASLRDYLGESLQIADLLTSQDSVDLAKSMLAMVREIEELGVTARYAIADLDNGFKAGALILLPAGHDLTNAELALFPTSLEGTLGSGPSADAVRLASCFLDAALRPNC